VEEFFRVVANGGVPAGDLELAPVNPDEIEADADGKYSSVAPDLAPVVLTWNNLSVSTKPKNGVSKTLIKNVQGTITGGLWGIMGASGSGKTTFLSVLSLRLDTYRMQCSGDIKLNGKTFDKALLKSMSGYVMQDDLVHAMLTVGETLRYTAALRMGWKYTRKERDDRCDEVLKLMGIDYCRDVIVGDTRNKGISGGERKRLCVAMELLTRPKLLFLDEPTSGLDSSTALSVMQSLKGLAESGECTVVCTIHQPQTKIYNIIDNLLLMKRGQIVYQGSRAMAESYFAAQGYPCPEKMNPADHLLDVVTIGTHDDKEESNLKRLTPPINMDYGIDKDDFSVRAVQPWLFQFYILTLRNLKEKFRRWDVYAMNIFITALIGVFIGMGSWYQIGTSQASIPKRNPILFFCVIHQGVVSSLQGTYAFPIDRALMLRERASGAYYVSAYFTSKSMVDMIFQLFLPVIFAAFVVPLTGLQNSGEKFCTFMAFNMLLAVCATSLSNMCSCLCVSIEMSTVVLACAMEITRLYSAFFVSPNLLLQSNDRWQFADALSYMKYGYVGLTLNEYKGLKFTCTAKQIAAKTCIATGEKYMAMTNTAGANLGYDRYTIEFCAGIMVVYLVGCRIVSYLALRFIKV